MRHDFDKPAMGPGKYTLLDPDLREIDTADIGQAARPVAGPSRTRKWAVTIILGLLCILEGATLIWTKQDPARCLSHSVSFQDEAPFGKAATEEEVEQAWRIYGLPNAGFVHIHRPEDLGLVPNHDVVPGIENVYMISAMHQLHCLQELQKMFTRWSTAWNVTADTSHGLGSKPEINHASHCFNYLRQGVLCSADGTLEGPDAQSEAGQSKLRGWGVSHECRPWERLMDFRNRHSIERR